LCRALSEGVGAVVEGELWGWVWHDVYVSELDAVLLWRGSCFSSMQLLSTLLDRSSLPPPELEPTLRQPHPCRPCNIALDITALPQVSTTV